MLVFLMILIGSEPYLNVYTLNTSERKVEEIDEFFLNGLLEEDVFTTDKSLATYMDSFVRSLFDDALNLKSNEQGYFNLALDYFRREIVLSINSNEYRYKHLLQVLKWAYHKLVKQWEDYEALIIFKLASTYYERVDMEISVTLDRVLPFVAVEDASVASRNLALIRDDIKIEEIDRALLNDDGYRASLVDIMIRSNNFKIKSKILTMLSHDYSRIYSDSLLHRWLIININEFNELVESSMDVLVNRYQNGLTDDIYAALLNHRESTNKTVSHQASLLIEKYKNVLQNRNYSWKPVCKDVLKNLL